ncbi:uncharacterized protein LOC120916344 [Rana temporaria]|uniref:uncharacterized protein LOC120916344 n=1 Tax=Rana temporaria TaxID=8407 RepID=UPI001AACC51B|nr:uncharacterized protein LOC120916344 [Rana temporaria]
MESGAEPRDRVLEEPISLSQNVVIRECGSTDHDAPQARSTKPAEKRKEHHPSKSSVVPTSHQRSSQSSSGGALDLQAVVGRPSSSISGMTVPIRLDALSYLLNSAVMGNYRMPYQTPYCPPSYPMCSYPQVGCSPYGMCMGSQYCSSALPNQYPGYQTGLSAYGNQQNMQAYQHPVPNFNQSMGDASQIQNTGTFPGVNPQGGMAFNPTGMAFNPTGMALNSTGMAFNTTGMALNSTGMALNSTGMAFNSAGTTSAQNISGASQPESNSWAKKPFEKAGTSEKFGNNWSNSFSSENEKQSSPRGGRFAERNEDRRGFGRFGDNRNEDSWSSRQQSNSFGRDFGRGRGSFGGSSWRGNSRGQNKEWTFGDRSRNADFGNKRKFGESPERSQDQGTFSKRGQWSGGRGRGRGSSDSWQQKNRQQDSQLWSSAADTPSTSSFGQETKTAVQSDAGDEDWETDYPEKSTASKLGDTSEKPVAQSPVPCSPKNNYEKVYESGEVLKPAEGFTEELTIVPETEEPQTDVISVKSDATVELEAKAEIQGSALSPAITSDQDDEIYAFIVTVDGEEDKGVLVEVNGNNT